VDLWNYLLLLHCLIDSDEQILSSFLVPSQS
jgi:hypothetical protein